MSALTSDARSPFVQPLRIVDVSPLHDHIPTATPSPDGPSRASRLVVATKANIVRLIPGVTRLPVGPESALRPGVA